ncbi:MAG TPA: hypothetical protein VFH68_10195 [Polyangia bacterium]|nr:hypothetical protein [Polyangia bacterium]
MVAQLACSSLRTDEGLAMLDVTAAADVPPFMTARFSVAGRPDVRPREVAYDGRTALRFGYYLPGPSGTVRITGQALSADCLFGGGTAEVNVQLGQTSAPIALQIKRAAEIDPRCLSSPDASADADGATTPPPPDASVPACLAATRKCAGASACCSGLTCGTTSLGQVCCGGFNVSCTLTGGEDCCGQLECVSNKCCLPATYPCQGGSCCAGLVCGTTSLGKVCCGNSGAPCHTDNGADCCGALRCVGRRVCGT